MGEPPPMDLKREVVTAISNAFTDPKPMSLNTHGRPIDQRCGPLTVKDFTNLLKLEAVQGTLSAAGGPEIEWSLDKKVAKSVSVMSGTTIAGARYKYSHDLISAGLTDLPVISTDKPLRTISALNDDWDACTPDFIERVDNGWVVVEVASIRAANVETVHTLYREKLFKYQQPLEARAVVSAAIIFVVVAVGMSHVCSTVALPRKVVNDLVTRKRLSVAIEDSYIALYGVPFRVDEATVLNRWEMNNIAKMMKSGVYDEKVASKEKPWLTSEFCISTKERANDTYVVNRFLTQVAEEITRVTETQVEDPNVTFSKFKEAHSKDNRRMDMKAVVNLPCILPMVDPEATTDIEYTTIPFNDGDPAFMKLWSIAFEQHQSNEVLHQEHPENLLSEALCDDPSELQVIEDSRKLNRKLYHRVNFANQITAEERVSLALNGLWAKSLKNHHAIKANRDESQKAFHWNTDVSDIQNFLRQSSLLDKAEFPTIEIMDLIEQANSYVQNNSEGVNSVKSMLQTKLGSYLNFIADVMTEVSISNKQNCKRHGMILKKLRHYKAFILISPTIGSQHCFVSFYFPLSTSEVLCQAPFLKFYESDWGYFTDFTSFKPGKIENKATMMPAFITLVSYWAWFYDHPGVNIAEFKSPQRPDSLAMLLLSILLRMEDKEASEFAITQTRYMFMEVFKGNHGFTKPNPLKVLSKLNTSPRSRLALWLNKQISLNFKIMQENPPTQNAAEVITLTDEEDAPPADSWMGLLNPITGGHIPTGSRAICLAYTGYLKNKNEDAEGNTDFQMLDKILEEEKDLDNVPLDAIYGRLGDDEEPMSKGFDKRMLAHGCEAMRVRLEKLLGQNWQDKITQDISKALSTKLSEDLATLKASCSIKHEEAPTMTANLSDRLSAGRVRVLEAIYKEVELYGLNPYLRFPKILEFVESHGGHIITDLFKKKQHGGLREIFVLTIHSRIIQLYIETISRVLCSYFEEETMTHPDNKIARIDEHRLSVHDLAMKRNCSSINYCNSMDKTRWSQSMMMTMLMVPLGYLLPSTMLPLVQRCLNCWVGKWIKIPQPVINTLLRSVELENPIFKDLKLKYENPRPDGLIERDLSSFISVRSGMMQGILHYTSSLLHVCFLNSMQVLIPSVIKSVSPNTDVVFTQVCSSDDSSCILSILDEPQKSAPSDDYKRACFFAMACLSTMGKFSRFYGLKDSIKSVEALCGIIEFNSEFVFNDTIAIPVIKFIAASLSVAESCSLVKRQQQLYNLLSDLFRSGFPAFNTHVCQIAQALLHYKLMGSGVNSLFPEYQKRLTMVPDPIYGFHLMDSMYFPGLMGLSFSHWCAAKNSNILRLPPQALATQELEVTAEGGIIRTLTIKMGRSRRWKAIIDNLRGEIDLATLIEQDPSLIFRPAKTIDELKGKLLLKATMPSVVDSMMRGNPYLQATASSVYSINTHCYSKVSLVDVAGKFQKEEAKTCMLLELDRRIEELKEEEAIPDADFKLAFPCQDRYQDALEVITDLNLHKVLPYHRLRQRRAYFSIQASQIDVGISLKAWCQNLWFGMNLNQTRVAVNRAAAYYCARLPWIRPTLRETLEQSPFCTYQELAGFLESYAVKSRVFMRFGPAAGGRSLKARLLSLGRKSFLDRKILHKTGMEKLKVRDTSLAHIINMAVCVPNDKARTELVLRELRSHEPLGITIDELQSLNYRDRKLALCQLIAQERMPSVEIINLALSTSSGLVITYSQMQERKENPETRKVTWTGEGQAIVYCMNLAIVINMTDDTCTSMFVNSWSGLNKHPKTLSVILSTLGLRPPPTRMRAHCIARFDESGFHPPQAGGIPILEDKNLLVNKVHRMELSLRVPFLGLQVRQNTPLVSRGDKRELILFTWRHSAAEVIIEPGLSSSGDLWDVWMNQDELSVDASLKLLSKYGTGQMKEAEGKWLLDILHARLVTLCGVNSTIRSSDWTALEEPGLTIEEVSSLSPEETQRLADEYWKAFDKTRAGEILGNVVRMTEVAGSNPESVLQDIMGGVRPYQVQPADTRKVGDFKRRLRMFDQLIKSVELETPSFWISTMNGIVPKGNKEFSELIMRLFRIAKVDEAMSIESRFAAIHQRERKKVEGPKEGAISEVDEDKLVQRAKEILESPKVEVPLNWADVEVSDSDSSSSADEDEIGLTEDDLLAAADELFTEMGLPVNSVQDSSELKAEIAEGDRIAANLARTPVSDIVGPIYTQVIRYVDMLKPYRPTGACTEPHKDLVWRGVQHDGNCGFYALQACLGDNRPVRRFKDQLLASRHAHLLTENESITILNNSSDQISADILRLICREFRVNICIHKDVEEYSRYGRSYIEVEVSPALSWVHLAWRDSEMAGVAKYDALIKDEPILQHAHVTVEEELTCRHGIEEPLLEQVEGLRQGILLLHDTVNAVRFQGLDLMKILHGITTSVSSHDYQKIVGQKEIYWPEVAYNKQNQLQNHIRIMSSLIKDASLRKPPTSHKAVDRIAEYLYTTDSYEKLDLWCSPDLGLDEEPACGAREENE